MQRIIKWFKSLGNSDTTYGSNLHRTNGPAVVYRDGFWLWRLNGKWHRYYGPQNHCQMWWIHNRFIK